MNAETIKYGVYPAAGKPHKARVDMIAVTASVPGATRAAVIRSGRFRFPDRLASATAFHRACIAASMTSPPGNSSRRGNLTSTNDRIVARLPGMRAK